MTGYLPTTLPYYNEEMEESEDPAPRGDVEMGSDDGLVDDVKLSLQKKASSHKARIEDDEDTAQRVFSQGVNENELYFLQFPQHINFGKDPDSQIPETKSEVNDPNNLGDEVEDWEVKQYA